MHSISKGSKLKSVSQTAIRLFFPQRCAVCNKVISIGETYCYSCAPKVRRISKTFLVSMASNPSLHFKTGKNTRFNGCIAPFFHQSGSKRTVYNYKFNARSELVDLLSYEMADVYFKYYDDIDFDGICFVPTSFARKLYYGFNHTRLLAKSVAKRTGLPLLNVLRQIGRKKKQHILRASLRAANVLGVYGVSGDVKGKTLLLIDDIVTTGATLNECAKVLKQNGAKAVYCLTANIND